MSYAPEVVGPGTADGSRAADEPLRVFAVFHLNLMFSSIEETRRPEVLERCYAPLFALASDVGLPLGFEASGLTLELLRELDPALLGRLRKLTTSGPCEFLGSGYAQLIGPLVPPSVNAANLRLGQDRVEALLGRRPGLGFVNEQAWSGGMVELYRDAGFDAVMMEWNNPARLRPDWDASWRFHPKRAVGPTGATLPVLWNDSVAFQKLQRLAHGDLEEDALVDWAAGFAAPGRCLALYGGDAEIFDFRPNRYAVEPTVEAGEWERIRRLFERIAHDPRFAWVAPSRALAELPADDELRLESAAQPCPVKKQPKYNLARWAVTGRDDLVVNSACHRIASALEARDAPDTDWQELCRLWSSDFRTHITETRWAGFRRRLAALEARVVPPQPVRAATLRRSGPDARWDRQGNRLRFESDRLRAWFNLRRGLALEALWWKDVSDRPLVGTLPHGTFDDISWAADFYTGHFVFQPPGSHQITDLSPTEPFLEGEGEERVSLMGTVPTELGPVEKRWVLDLAQARVTLCHRFYWAEPSVGTLRLGHVTLRPEAFDATTLRYRTGNGGAPETFVLGSGGFDHGRAVSALVSATDALGLPEGWLELGDAERTVRIETRPGQAACAAMLCYAPMEDTFFLRASLSAREFDDTRQPVANDGLTCELSLTARR